MELTEQEKIDLKNFQQHLDSSSNQEWAEGRRQYLDSLRYARPEFLQEVVKQKNNQGQTWYSYIAKEYVGEKNNPYKKLQESLGKVAEAVEINPLTGEEKQVKSGEEKQVKSDELGRRIIDSNIVIVNGKKQISQEKYMQDVMAEAQRLGKPEDYIEKAQNEGNVELKPNKLRFVNNHQGNIGISKPMTMEEMLTQANVIIRDSNAEERARIDEKPQSRLARIAKKVGKFIGSDQKNKVNKSKGKPKKNTSKNKPLKNLVNK